MMKKTATIIVLVGMCSVLLIKVAMASENHSNNSISNSATQSQTLAISSMFTGKDISITNKTIIDQYHKYNGFDIELLSIFNVQSSYDYAFSQKMINKDDIEGYFENSMKYSALLPLWEREAFLRDVYQNMKSIISEEDVYVRAIKHNMESLSKRLERSKKTDFSRKIIENERKAYEELQLARLRYAKEIITGGELFYDKEYCDHQIRALTRFNVYNGSSDSILMEKFIRELIKQKKRGTSGQQIDLPHKQNYP